MKETEKKTLEAIESLSLGATEQERHIIIAYIQGVALGRKIAREEVKTEKKEAFENRVQVSRI